MADAWLHEAVAKDSIDGVIITTDSIVGRCLRAVRAFQIGDVVLKSPAYAGTGMLSLQFLAEVPGITARFPHVNTMDPGPPGHIDWYGVESLIPPQAVLTCRIISNNCLGSARWRAGPARRFAVPEPSITTDDPSAHEGWLVAPSFSMAEHSCAFNCVAVAASAHVQLLAVKPIAAGDRLTIAYGTCTEAAKYGVKCACGAAYNGTLTDAVAAKLVHAAVHAAGRIHLRPPTLRCVPGTQALARDLVAVTAVLNEIRGMYGMSPVTTAEVDALLWREFD